jgi:hypothetical protein
MTNCLQCNAELTHVEGRKQKSFCNVNCRNKYFYAQRKKTVEEAIEITNGKEVKVTDLTKPNVEVKPKEVATTNTTINTMRKKYNFSKMPSGLTHFEQLAWKDKTRKEQDGI